jgi:ferredoxin
MPRCHGIPWPVGYDDIAPWYSYVEKFVGINGKKEGLPQLPDSEFQKPMPWFALEHTIHERLKKKAPDVTLTNGRCAVLTEDLPGRQACHYCGPCERGCSTGSYFSSQSSTLPAAAATGKLTLRANSLVERLEYDNATGRIAQCVITPLPRSAWHFRRKYFSVRICGRRYPDPDELEQQAFPNRLANSSGVLGRYMMDHTTGVSTIGFLDNMVDYYHITGPPACIPPSGMSVDRTGTPISCAARLSDSDHAHGLANRDQCQGFGARLKDKLPEARAMDLRTGQRVPAAQSNRMYLSRDRYGTAGGV